MPAAAFAWATMALNASGSCTARSARTLRSTSIPAFDSAVDAEMTYSRFIAALSKAGIEVDRKVLADLAVHEPEAFSAIVAQAKAAAGTEAVAA